MDISTACRILGVDTSVTLDGIKSVKRKLLQALHPDKHPPEQREVFTKMTRDVIEASEFLEKTISLSEGRPRDHTDTILEQTLFNEEMTFRRKQGPFSQSKSLVKYEKRYTNDKVLAVVVLGIDYGFTWQINPSPLFGGGQQPQTHYGCALQLLVMNRTDRPISHLHIGYNSFLVDDRGYQYSPINNSFYWVSEGGGQFNIHSDFLAPDSKVDGFVLFPCLRKGSEKFARWFLRGNFKVDEEYYEGNYDVCLS